MYWIIFGGLFLIALIWGAIRWESEVSNSEGSLVGIFLVVSVFGVMVGLLMISSNYSDFISNRTFYEINANIYTQTTERAESYLSGNLSGTGLIQGSIEKFQQAGVATDRLKEQRDAIVKYNTSIARAKFWDRFWLTDALYPDGVQDLPYLKP